MTAAPVTAQNIQSGTRSGSHANDGLPTISARRAFSRIVPVTQRHAIDRHHLETNSRFSVAWAGPLETHESLAEVLVEAASSGGAGTSCRRWRAVCGHERAFSAEAS